jgi:hypothetical protein
MIFINGFLKLVFVVCIVVPFYIFMFLALLVSVFRLFANFDFLHLVSFLILLFIVYLINSIFQRFFKGFYISNSRTTKRRYRRKR